MKLPSGHVGTILSGTKSFEGPEQQEILLFQTQQSQFMSTKRELAQGSLTLKEFTFTNWKLLPQATG